MRYRISKEFGRALDKLSGKELKQALKVLDSVEKADNLLQIGNCKKLVGYENVYRIRIGSRRAFFTLHIEVVGELLFFRYLVSRGQAYDKAIEKKLRK